eukprot:364639-Chlamydomonas_euryale.AAC.5
MGGRSGQEAALGSGVVLCPHDPARCINSVEICHACTRHMCTHAGRRWAKQPMPPPPPLLPPSLPGNRPHN